MDGALGDGVGGGGRGEGVGEGERAGDEDGLRLGRAAPGVAAEGEDGLEVRDADQSVRFAVVVVESPRGKEGGHGWFYVFE